MPRYFTREEAEALLPALTIVLSQLRDQYKKVRAFEEELAQLQIKAMGNGHGLLTRIAELHDEVGESIDTLRDLIEKVQSFGCELKDPELGLVDFLSLRNGQAVYLCWHLGEEHIAFWHHLDTGFAGRQPL
ncbi:hypothetical protein EI42_04251 [Thermosporothrix hazakensis]|jgi:hypothetical protein|uniref:DUF2203 family protein n=2 Tax=Thermosporothrix TaxID=768650 RepID=A0A326U3S9_THEHA|nr:DUF2203 domain-containing protein [Thermosporothrix hazakensis]PZW25407.1 hypothetical protein EI42_04251 [Thermosporothrix hazakensis]BBH90742.1 hypothetical protein KTC_54930 [Thermosporothrix sp. COM3]GCE48792.1 hypothetical protein KTH_36610 [Thermosporothrix hazakensis]